jgi:hypothetical protein
VECIKKMYEGIKFCVKCDGDNVTDFVEQRSVGGGGGDKAVV